MDSGYAPLLYQNASSHGKLQKNWKKIIYFMQIRIISSPIT